MKDTIHVTALPFFLRERSDPLDSRFVFGYQIRIENAGDESARLRWRHWYIHDPTGGDSEVEGEGVVGEQPLLAPGDVHEYQSFCVLRSPEGYMEGHYEFERPDGSRFQTPVPRFRLTASKGSSSEE